ncbi:putative aryl-alcohol dehydrogenase [Gordonia aichiensis NBRC 108223]|uniref:Putative aryl-alcohol dehydrogenase n=1 Tax=Gordonia aichiensis NBRC 108223 TaxID=1220583 RepID=L7KGM2_9ACTN|nr:putative aryl-alcohol dehydrogenase [Gordonia aichiensis NBRC 108223]
MRAAVAATIGAPLTVEEVEVGAPAAGELRIELTGSGICHTDLSARDGQFPAQFPIVLGHEGTGTVTAVGEGVDDVGVGDRVVLTIDHCGQCRSCDRGRFWACANAFGMNVAGGRADGTTAFTLDGNPIHSHWFGQSSFAATILAPRSTAVVVADDVPAEVAAPLGCGIITGAGPVLYPQTTRPMDSLAVFGLGTVGLGAVMAARIRGVEQVIGVDPVASRRELARELGATDVVDPSTSDAVEEIQRITGGGADQALETSGAAGVLDVAVAATITGGHCGVIGATTGHHVHHRCHHVHRPQHLHLRCGDRRLRRQPGDPRTRRPLAHRCSTCATTGHRLRHGLDQRRDRRGQERPGHQTGHRVLTDFSQPTTTLVSQRLWARRATNNVNDRPRRSWKGGHQCPHSTTAWPRPRYPPARWSKPMYSSSDPDRQARLRR